ncbi:amidohydrolase family protein [Rothia terrae]|uniref:amidohydrolase family protein n=1 Tax=Rothia terrae TaxID=396015 RepID=UPI0034054786
MTEHIIDTHAHLYPARYLDFLEEHGMSAELTKIARDMRASDEPEEMAARIQQMDEAGVQEQMLSVTPQAPMLQDANAALEGARMVNDIYIEQMKKHPGRFRAYLALPVPHVKESLTILDEYFEQDGFVGVTVPTFINGSMSLDDESLEPFYARLNELSARVYVHPTGGGAQSPAINDFWLQWVNGAPIEDAIATLHLLKADIPHKYPNIRFHIAHLGGDLAFLTQRLEDNYEDWGSFEHSPMQR